MGAGKTSSRLRRAFDIYLGSGPVETRFRAGILPESDSQRSIYLSVHGCGDLEDQGCYL